MNAVHAYSLAIELFGVKVNLLLLKSKYVSFPLTAAWLEISHGYMQLSAFQKLLHNAEQACSAKTWQYLQVMALDVCPQCVQYTSTGGLFES